MHLLDASRKATGKGHYELPRCQSALPDLLLDPAAPSNAAARAHRYLRRLPPGVQLSRSHFRPARLWHAPEPSPYFDQKLAVRLREDQAMAPAGWFDRMRTRLLFNTGRQFRPALAGALALILLIGGGTFASITISHSGRVEASAAVEDLQILDKIDRHYRRWINFCRTTAQPTTPTRLPAANILQH